MADIYDYDIANISDNDSDNESLTGGSKLKKMKSKISSTHDEGSSDEEYDTRGPQKGGADGEGFEEEDDDEDDDEVDDDNSQSDGDVDMDEIDDLEENSIKALREANILDSIEVQNRRNFDDTDEEEEEEEEDDDYLQKLSESHKKKIIQDYHPELKSLNYEEIDALCTIVRDAAGNIIDPLHKTVPILSRYERTRVLGERADQINSGAQPFIEVESSMIDGYLIALKELEQKKIPFIIQRPLPNGTSEYWRLRDLEQL
jgi:DNA-directed RNA polymerase I, II, and III subunit RPABC2